MDKSVELAEAQRLAHIGSWYWDAGTGVYTSSEEMCRMFGREVIPPFAEQCGTLYTAETWQLLNTAIQEAVRTGITYNLELPALRKDGTGIWIIAHGEPARNADGKVVGLRGTVQDITERRDADKQVRLHASLLSAVGQAVIATDTEGGIIFMNRAAEILFGWHADEAVGRNIVEVTVPEISQAQAVEIMKRLAEGKAWSGEFFVKHRDGATFLAEVIDTPVLDEQGKLIGIVGTSKDITGRKQAEMELRESKRLLDFTMQLSHMGGWDLNLLDHTANRTLGHDRIFGYESLLPEWNYDKFLEHVLAEDRTEVDRRFREAIAAQTDWNFECRIRRTDGEVRWILVAGGHQRNDRGEVWRMSGIVQDITEHKRLDEALQARNTELENARFVAEQANLAKSNFISSMSHELRTPLNAILGFAQLLEAGSPPLQDTQIARLQQISKAGWYLLELINEILDLALVESGKLSLLSEPVSLADVMCECRSMIESQAQARGIQVNFLPVDDTWYAHADRTRLKQVIVNLLSNAIKYNRAQGTVEVRCTCTPDRIRINIKDTGMGLPAELQRQLFQPFNRLGQEGGAVEGTGIGLVVTKQLVELMGGTIGVKSTVGVGSEFRFDLIRAVTPQQAAGNIIPVDFARHEPASTPQRTLLYVEDNPANLMLIEQIVADQPGLRMLSARDGNFGIALARTHLPDVILMDVNLPGISGIEAMNILHQDPATVHIPIIALSANAMLHDKEQGLEAGFIRYLTKPVRVNEFLATLDEVLELSKRKPTNANETGQIS